MMEHFAATVLEALPSAVLVANDEGRTLFANARAADVLGKTANELCRINISELFLCKEGDARLTTKLRRSNGEIITVGYTVSKVASGDGRNLCAISFRD